MDRNTRHECNDERVIDTLFLFLFATIYFSSLPPPYELFMFSHPIRYRMFFVQFSHHCHNIFWHRFPIWLIFIFKSKKFCSFSSPYTHTYVGIAHLLVFDSKREMHCYESCIIVERGCFLRHLGSTLSFDI